MFPDARLAPEHVEASVLHNRVLFVVATAESGAELVVRALGRMPGVSALPVPTNLFSTGIDGLLDCWLANQDEERVYGLADLVDEQELLLHARRLGDELLVQCARSEPGESDGLIVEYSPAHIRSLVAISAVYPDAEVLHIVRDGGDIAGRLASLNRELFWPRPQPLARRAAEEWCEDQRAVDEFEDADNYRVGRIERILADPVAFLGWLAEGIGLDVDGDDLIAAADALGGGTWELTKPQMGKAQALVNVLGADVLERYEYAPANVGEVATLTTRAELGYEQLNVRAREALMGLSERLREMSVRWSQDEGTEEP